MKTLNETTLATVLQPFAAHSPLLAKSALAYLLTNDSGLVLKYEQKKKSETVIGKVQPGQLIVVQPGDGEYHFVKSGNHDIEHAILDEAEALELAASRNNASITSSQQVEDAIKHLVDFNPGLDGAKLTRIGWVNSTNKVRAYLKPEGFGDFQVDKTASWGEMQPGNDNHALIVSDGKSDAYCNIISNLKTDWYVVDDNRTGDDLIAALPHVSEEDLAPALV